MHVTVYMKERGIFGNAVLILRTAQIRDKYCLRSGHLEKSHRSARSTRVSPSSPKVRVYPSISIHSSTSSVLVNAGSDKLHYLQALWIGS
jgi:hypothetical protein